MKLATKKGYAQPKKSKGKKFNAKAYSKMRTKVFSLDSKEQSGKV